jgi:hypothetical protein
MGSTIQVKNASEGLKSRLQSSADRNFRSLNQEALARLEFSFDIEDALLTQVHQRWIDEAMEGTLKPGSMERLKRIAAKAKAAK